MNCTWFCVCWQPPSSSRNKVMDHSNKNIIIYKYNNKLTIVKKKSNTD